ncbi:RTP1 [Cervus elaphus hippelaphus]|uniref:RTP1 n=1 Tax=Cervus elaphus hippelaphus TaxID=46360 RepID=A0A212CJK5_CEREH|nr:RTP1 [Cervus elaphus hippelaphus]
MRIFRPWRLRCPALHLPSLPVFSFKWSLPSLAPDETMCKSVTTGEWKKIFYEKMEEAKPADSWDLIIDPNLKHNVLAPGWKQYLELHASGSRQDTRRHRGEFCEACQEGIVHWKPSEKLLEEEATTYTFSRAPSPTKPPAEEGSGCNFFSIPWCLFWATVLLLIIYLQFSFRSSV